MCDFGGMVGRSLGLISMRPGVCSVMILERAVNSTEYGSQMVTWSREH